MVFSSLGDGLLVSGGWSTLVATLQHHVDGGIRAVDDRMESELPLMPIVAA